MAAVLTAAYDASMYYWHYGATIIPRAGDFDIYCRR
jgi:hypothetical protein